MEPELTWIAILAGLGILGGLLYLADTLVKLVFGLVGLLLGPVAPTSDPDNQVKEDGDKMGQRIPWRAIWCTHPEDQVEKDGDSVVCGKYSLVIGKADPEQW